MSDISFDPLPYLPYLPWHDHRVWHLAQPDAGIHHAQIHAAHVKRAAKARQGRRRCTEGAREAAKELGQIPEETARDIDLAADQAWSACVTSWMRSTVAIDL